jgi:hypothetical protein
MQSSSRSFTAKLVPLIATFLLLIVALAANSAAQAAPSDAPQAGPTPKGSGPSGPSGPATTLRTISGNPLQILVAADGSAQVFYNYSPPVSPNGQFYPASQNLADMGIFAWVGNSVYGPNLGSRTTAYGIPLPTPFTETSQSNVTGSGTAGDPFVITTMLGLPPSSIVISEKITYVNGQQYYRMDSQIRNTSTQTPASLTYFHAGDIFLKGSDFGFGYYNPSTGGVGGKNQTQDWFVVFQPSTPVSKYEEDDFSTIWDDIGHGVPGPGFHNTVRLNDNIDNGAGLQWSNLTIAAGQSTTISDYLSFGATPVVINPPPPSGPPAQVPEGDTLVLVGTGLAGLAGYASLRWRARRAK